MIKGIAHNKTPYFLEVIDSEKRIKPSDFEDFRNNIKGIKKTDMINKFSINHK